MNALLRYELKSGFKNFLIWAFAVGGMGLVCILLYKSMESGMKDMAASFSSMGSFSDAFGMNQLSIATVKGYFATEIGTIHVLGSSLFAASIATVVLSKEEDGHTAEFTFTLPVSRVKTVLVKFVSVISYLVLFTLVCGVLYQTGFLLIGEKGLGSDFILFLASQFLMNIEIAGICFLVSAVSMKNKPGIGIGIAMILYAYDLMARVVPDLKDILFVSPFSYANATGIFTGNADNALALLWGCVVIVVTMVAAVLVYLKRDLAS